MNLYKLITKCGTGLGCVFWSLCLVNQHIYADVCTEAANMGVISPCNYLQDPFGLIGLSTRAGSSGTYNLGISVIDNNTISTLNYSNEVGIGYAAEAWGQTSRWNGFALGGALMVSNAGLNLLNPVYNNKPNPLYTYAWVIPSQAYLNYQYKNYFDISAGNIILTTPWVNSNTTIPPDLINDTYQGISANLQLTSSILVTGFSIFTYQMYPATWWSDTTYYNKPGSVLPALGSTTTPGAAGLGMQYKPAKVDTFNLWFYQFYNYANMVYTDNTYRFNVTDRLSLDFAAQGAIQDSNGTNIIAGQPLPGGQVQAGSPDGNVIGAKLAINVPYDTLSVSFNNIFGPPDSFLGGAIVTPYTYSLETDPLYTSTQLSSLAELGSGSAYSIKDRIHTQDEMLSFTASFTTYFINQVYATQPNMVQEYDAKLNYSMPHTGLSLMARLVYIKEPVYTGPSTLYPKLVVAYVF